MHRSRKKSAPKHQNKKAFYHNPGSKKTAVIAQISHSGLCQRCDKIIAWKKQYRKYKALKHPKKCADCHLRKIGRNYHTVCDDCAVKRGGVCAKCLLTEEQSRAQAEKGGGRKKKGEAAAGAGAGTEAGGKDGAKVGGEGGVGGKGANGAKQEGQGEVQQGEGQEQEQEEEGEEAEAEEEGEESSEDEEERARSKFGTTGTGINCGGLERWMESVVPDELRGKRKAPEGPVGAAAAAAAAAAAKEAKEKKRFQLADGVTEEAFLAQEKSAAGNLESFLALKKKRKAVNKKQRRRL